MIDAASLGSLVLWWLAVLALGLLAWPLSIGLFRSPDCRSYLAAKPLGWLFAAYAAWLASALGIASYWKAGVPIGLGALALASAVAVWRRPLARPFFVRIAQWEMGFALVLVAGVILRAAIPDIEGLEKFMDFGFINAALRAEAMPPIDHWWAGEPINYYYFGHAAVAWLILLAGVPSDHGYNLMVGLLFAFTGTLAYGIVKTALRAGGRRVAALSGLFAGLLVTLGGNFHSVLYGTLRPWSFTTYDRDFFYPDSTRFIGFDPPTGNKSFTEMPAYGFGVADLHAHLINLPAAFLIVSVLTRHLLAAAGPDREAPSVRDAMALALLFALSAMTNAWDAASYGLLLGLTGLGAWLARGSLGPGGLLGTLAWGAAIVGGAILLALPFLAQFRPIASELRWTDERTPLWQLAVIYADVALPCALLILGLFRKRLRSPAWIAGAVLALFAALLIALPEIGYVKDIYGEDHRRANTMFKLTFEAQPMAMLASMILIGLLLQARSRWAPASGFVLALPLLATLSYADKVHGGTFRELGTRSFTLQGLRFIGQRHPDDGPILDHLRSIPPSRHAVLLEGDGDSYTNAARFSAMSGIPTVLGWFGHEWLWRGDVDAVAARSREVRDFFLAKDRATACRILARHGVTHVAIGDMERQRFPGLNQALLEALGSVVVRSGSSVLIEVNRAHCGF